MARKTGKSGSWLKKLMVFLNVLAVLALLGSYAALFIDPRTFWPPAFAGLAYPVILAVNVAFVLLWLLTWKKYVFLSLLPILAGLTQVMTLIPFHLSDPEAPLENDIRVVTYNIHGFNYIKDESVTTQERIISLLRSEKPAIVCFQEFKPRGTATLQSLGDSIGLSSFYQKNYLEYRSTEVVYGVIIYSIYPVLQSGYLRDDRNRVFAIWADVQRGNGKFRIYNCHLVSVRFGSKEYSFYEDLKNQETEKLDLQEGIFNILKKLKRAFILRSEQTEKLVASIKKSPYPVILAGDLNDSPFSFCFHSLTRELKDSYREAGSGWRGNTFAGQFPSYRIDHIMHGPKFRAVAYRKFLSEFSDHYPVSVTLRSQN